LQKYNFTDTFDMTLACKQRRLHDDYGETVMKSVLGAVALCALFAGFAQAEVSDRIVAADVPPQVLYENIVTAATSMCREGANKKTVAEINRPSLTLYAQTTSPSDIGKRDT
jgi:hypothetical protein